MAEVKVASSFLRQSKRLLKKYKSLADDLEQLIANLAENPEQGKSLGKSCYKVRMAITSKNKGKSGGARVITLFQRVDDTLILIKVSRKVFLM